MKTYKMLKTTTGVREGDVYPSKFDKGETYEIDEALAEQFYHQAAITEVDDNGKAIDPESREKKVTGPTEFKEGEAGVDLNTQNIEELVATARDIYGLDVDTTMSVEDVKAMIDAAQADTTESEDGDADKKPKKRKK